MQISECVVHLSNAAFIYAMPLLSSASVLTFASPWVTTLCNRWQQHLLQSDIPSLLDAPRPLNALLTFIPASITNVVWRVPLLRLRPGPLAHTVALRGLEACPHSLTGGAALGSLWPARWMAALRGPV